MNRKQFLKRLEKGLQTVDYDVRHDFLNEFDVHIRQGIETGLSEEEVVASLGDIDEILSELLEEEEINIVKNQKSLKEDTPKRRVIVERSNYADATSTNLEINPDDVDAIEISLKFTTIVIEQGDTFNIEYEVSKHRKPVQHMIKNRTLIFSDDEDQDHKTYNVSIVSHIMGMIRGNNSYKNKLIITWPKGLNHLDMKNSGGSIRVTGIEAERIHAFCEMGSVILQHVVTEKVDATSDMGKVRIEDSKIDSVKAASDMGSVTVQDVHANHYELKSDMGSVRGYGINPDADGVFETDMGKVVVRFNHEPKETNFILAQDIMGTINQSYEGNPNGKYQMLFKADMGSITIE